MNWANLVAERLHAIKLKAKTAIIGHRGVELILKEPYNVGEAQNLVDLELLRGKFVAGQKNKIKKSSHNRVFIRIASMASILAVASAVAIYFEQET